MTTEYHTYLLSLAHKLENFNLKNGDIFENYKRNNLYLILFAGEFANSNKYKEAANFIELIFNHSKKRNISHHLIISEGLKNEVNKQQNKPITKGIQFPKWLQSKENLDILCNHLEYLLGKNTITVEPQYEQLALNASIRHIKTELEYLYSLNY